MYEVGGCVRDEILGTPSKDIDFTVVLAQHDWNPIGGLEFNPFQTMVDMLKKQGFTIFVTTPEFLTARGRFPKNHPVYPGMAADFVLARKEAGYTDGRRPDKVVPGTLEDDLRRRDLTINAIAKDAKGNVIDPHGGVSDISLRLIRAVGDPFDRLEEDALRALRAVRFSVTKGFEIEPELAIAIESPAVHYRIVNKIADERIADELSKMFRFDTLKSMTVLNRFPSLSEAIFSGRVSLDATMKQKGRG
jgi:tRNA nucleotidyltransferase (CCA-adding enzyme)